MTCTICGKATGPGALLCRPCKAALKRARQLTVQDFPGTPATVTMPAGLIQPLRDGVRPPRASSRRSDALRRVAWGVLAVALLVAAGYVGQRGMAGAGAASTAAASTTVVTPPAAPPTPAVLPEPVHVIEPAPIVNTPAPRRAPAAKAPAPSAERSTSPSMALEPPMPATAPPTDAKATVAEAAAPAPAPRVAPSAPDRWQTMADSLARCANEGGFGGFICDQRVRLQSCEGYWGQVAQCPNPPENPR
jgi:hypothetical protein